MKRHLFPYLALVAFAVSACSKEQPAPANATASASVSAASTPPPVMPGAKPFKQGKPDVPDPVMLQKKIDEARAQSEKEAKK